MSISTEKCTDTFFAIAAGVAASCQWPLFSETEVEVIYGLAAISATLNTDYTITLDTVNYNTFTVTPTAAFITKINNLIAADPTEQNYMLVRRVMPNTIAVTPDSARNPGFLQRELERMIMRFQGYTEKLQRVLLLPPNVAGDPVVDYTLDPPEEGAALVWEGNKLVPGPTADDIENAEGFAGTAQAASDQAQVYAQQAFQNYKGTSNTNLVVATGAKTFNNVVNGALLDTTMFALFASASEPTKYMYGQITARTANSITANITAIGAAGTKADWIITLSSVQGVQGLPGAPGAGTGDVVAANNFSEYAAALPAARTGLGLGTGSDVTFNKLLLNALTNFLTFAAGAANKGIMTMAALTATRTWSFPDKSGTVAMTSDIPSGTVTAVDVSYTTSDSATVMTPTTAAWTSFVMNTTNKNNVVGATSVAGTVILPAGDYLYNYGMTVENITSSQGAAVATRLRNITDGTTIADSVINNRLGLYVGQRQSKNGSFTLAGTKTIELQYFFQATGAPRIGSNYPSCGESNVSWANAVFEKV